MSTRVTLYTRANCHLCDDARAVVTEVCGALDAAWREVDIDTEPALQARFTDEVPVVEVDGAVVGFWRVDREQLLTALS